WVFMRLAVALPCLMALPATADMVHEEPLLFKLMLDRLEVSDADGNPVAWKAQAWAGSELRRLWVETRGAYVDSEVADTELQVLYSHAITPYWDARIGLRADVRPTPGREWLALGVHGLAPWFVDVD